MPISMMQLLGYAAVSVVLAVIPGPSVLLETTRAITRGRSAAMWVVAGSALGGLVLIGLVITGLGALVAVSATAFQVVKILGAVYLAVIGIRSLLASRGATLTEDGEAPPARASSGLRALRQGATVGVSNPKSLVSLMAIQPQFVDHARGHVVVQLICIGLTGICVQVVVETCFVHIASAMRAWFERRRWRLRALTAGAGVAMLGMAGKLAVER